MSSDDSDYNPGRASRPRRTSHRRIQSLHEPTLIRQRGGCLTCRARRKGCSDQIVNGKIPTKGCRDCQRLGIECLGYFNRRPAFMKDKSNFAALKGYIADHCCGPHKTKASQQNTLSLSPFYTNYPGWTPPFPVDPPSPTISDLSTLSSPASTTSEHFHSSASPPSASSTVYSPKSPTFDLSQAPPPLGQAPYAYASYSSDYAIPYYFSDPLMQGQDAQSGIAAKAAPSDYIPGQEVLDSAFPQPPYTSEYEYPSITESSFSVQYPGTPYQPASTVPDLHTPPNISTLTSNPASTTPINTDIAPMMSISVQIQSLISWHPLLHPFFYHEAAQSLGLSSIIGANPVAFDSVTEMATIVTALFGINFSMFQGGGFDWQDHLQVGCEWVKLTWPSIVSGNSPPVFVIFTGMIVWYDILASTSLRREPLLGVALLTDILVQHGNLVELSEIMGSDNQIMLGIAYTSKLAGLLWQCEPAWRTNVETAAYTWKVASEIRSRYLVGQSRINNSRPESPIDFPYAAYVASSSIPAPYLSSPSFDPINSSYPSLPMPFNSPSPPPIPTSSQVFVSAAKVYLQSVMSLSFDNRVELDSAVTDAVEVLKRASLLSSHSVMFHHSLEWPLTVIGPMVRAEYGDRDFILEAFQLEKMIVHERLGRWNYDDAEAIVRAVWAAQDAVNAVAALSTYHPSYPFPPANPPIIHWVDHLGLNPILLA